MHDHSHHSHNHESTKNISIAFFLNLGFAIAEIFIAVWTNSLAVLSNSLHDFGDSFSLGMSWYFDKISKKKRDETFTYGFKRFSIIPVVINSLILVFGSLYILYEAINRIISPEQTKAEGVLVFALIGMLINLIAFLRLKKGNSLNEQSASLHLLDDVLGLFAVLVVSIVIRFWNIPILDPVLSIVITLFIFTKIWQNIKSANLIFLQAIPKDLNIKELEIKLKELNGVVSTHDFHLWSLDGENHVLTVHLVVNGKPSIDKITNIKCAAREMVEKFGINHPTIEIEMENESCELGHC